jgi:excisionase family DNA binding protein
MEKLLSVKEIFEIIPVKEVTLRRYVSQHKVEHVKFGRRVLFRPETIENLIASKTVKARRGLRPECRLPS